MASTDAMILVGCYTQDLGFVKGLGDGINVLKVNASGEFTHVSTSAISHHNPTYIAAEGSTAYVVYEQYEANSLIESYAVAEGGELKLLNKVDAKGTAGCYLEVDKSKKHLLCANYMSGSTVVYPLNADGSLGDEPTSFEQYGAGCEVNAERQEHAHAHMATQDPSGKYVYVPDLGTDQVRQYTLDSATGKLASVAAAPAMKTKAAGSGPRHMVFHPTLPIAYVVNELLSTVCTCSFDASTGALTELAAVSTLPEGVKVGVGGESFCAAIRVSGDGKWVYASNRGHDSICRLGVDQATGALKHEACHPCGGKTPRDMTIVGGLMIVACQDSSYVTSLAISAEDGALTSTGHKYECGTPSAICQVA